MRAPGPIVQNRAAGSLAIALPDQSTIPPRLGLESSTRIFNFFFALRYAHTSANDE